METENRLHSDCHHDETGDHDGQSTATRNPNSAVVYVAKRWGDLQPHVREAILTLVDAGIRRKEAGEQRG